VHADFATVADGQGVAEPMTVSKGSAFDVMLIPICDHEEVSASTVSVIAAAPLA
jgi:citrate synthase